MIFRRFSLWTTCLQRIWSDKCRPKVVEKHRLWHRSDVGISVFSAHSDTVSRCFDKISELVKLLEQIIKISPSGIWEAVSGNLAGICRTACATSLTPAAGYHSSTTNWRLRSRLGFLYGLGCWRASSPRPNPYKNCPALPGSLSLMWSGWDSNPRPTA